MSTSENLLTVLAQLDELYSDLYDQAVDQARAALWDGHQARMAKIGEEYLASAQTDADWTVCKLQGQAEEAQLNGAVQFRAIEATSDVRKLRAHFYKVCMERQEAEKAAV